MPRQAEQNEAKLPAWAQSRLRNLRGQLEDAQSRIAVLTKEVDPDGGANVFLQDFVSLDLIPIGKDVSIRFVLRGHGRHMDIDIDSDRVEVHGSAPLNFSVRASNDIIIDTNRSYAG